MSNTRRLKKPPTGYSYEKFARIVAGLDLTYAEKQELLVQAMQADKNGEIHGTDTTLRDLRDRSYPA